MHYAYKYALCIQITNSLKPVLLHVIEDQRGSWCTGGIDCAVVVCQNYRLFLWVYAPSKSITAVNVQVCLCVWLYVEYEEEYQMRINHCMGYI